MKKLMNLFLIPTSDYLAPIGQFEDTGNFIVRNPVDISRGASHHLYITCDDTIEVGDYVFVVLPGIPLEFSLIQRVKEVTKDAGNGKPVYTVCDVDGTKNRLFSTHSFIEKIVCSTRKDLPLPEPNRVSLENLFASNKEKKTTIEVDIITEGTGKSTVRSKHFTLLDLKNNEVTFSIEKKEIEYLPMCQVRKLVSQAWEASQKLAHGRDTVTYFEFCKKYLPD